jgi:outer membrane lipoprotein-sorting protein
VRVLGLAAVAMLAGGCSVSKKTAVAPAEKPGPVQTATKAELVAKYNQQANAITSLNATVSLKLTAGSAYSGVIEQYHEVSAFILAQRPADIRMIGQAPVVGKNIFDMVSDGATFSVFIPSKNKFITGPSNFERRADKPIENLRPQHLVDALLWAPIPDAGLVLIEEGDEGARRFYVLTVVLSEIEAMGAAPGGARHTNYYIGNKVFFDRSDLHVARIETFEMDGRLRSDAQFSGSMPAGNTTYPASILISRPGEDYKLQIDVKKLTVNETIAPDRFVLKQPDGTDLVTVGNDLKTPSGKSDSTDSKEQHP